MSHHYSRLPTAESTDEFVGVQSRVFQDHIQSQNAHLDVLELSLKRLGDLGKGIQDELQMQNKMLNELERDLETGQQNLDTITKKVDFMIKKSGGPKYFSIIVVLTIILIILIFLFIYT